jgi:hypothetical protein
MEESQLRENRERVDGNEDEEDFLPDAILVGEEPSNCWAADMNCSSSVA